MKISSDKERWLPIKGYIGSYEISSLGRVKSLPRKYTRKKIRFLKAAAAGNGYLFVLLSKNGITKQNYIHRLVAKHFIDGYFKDATVNHKDFDRKNNDVNNLEWMTLIQNVRHGIPRRNPLFWWGRKTQKLSYEEVKNIRDDYKKLNTNYVKLAKKYCVSAVHISNIINMKTRIYA